MTFWKEDLEEFELFKPRPAEGSTGRPRPDLDEDYDGDDGQVQRGLRRKRRAPLGHRFRRSACRWILDTTATLVSTDGGPGLRPDNTLQPDSEGRFPCMPTCLSCRLDLSKKTPLLPRCALANDNLILREPVAFRKNGAKLSPMTFAMLALELVTHALPAEPEVSQQFFADGLSIALAGASVDDLDKQATGVQATTHTPHLILGPATLDAPEVPVPESIVTEDGRAMEDASASTKPNVQHDPAPPPENQRPVTAETADDLCPDSDDVNLHCAATDFSTGALDADRAACEFAAKLELLPSKLSTDAPTTVVATDIESLQALANHLNTDEYRKQYDSALQAMDAAEGRENGVACSCYVLSSAMKSTQLCHMTALLPTQPRWAADLDFLCVLHDSWRRMEFTPRAGAHVRRRGFQTSVNLVCQATGTQLRSAFDSKGDKAGFRERLFPDNAPASLREAVRNLLFFSNDVVGSEGARQQLRHEQTGDMLRFGGIGGFLIPNDLDSDGEPISSMAEEALVRRVAEVAERLRGAEEAARRSSDPDTFIGTLARYDPDQGFGFVVCPECASRWGKNDIYVGQKNVLENGLEIGDVIAFRVEDNNGKPRVAMNPKVLKEPVRLKKKLLKLREAARTAAAKRPAKVTGVVVPPPKRAALGAGLLAREG
ncbi:unnamed protein product [Prorocentrum cordatum]|uniref:CSD domain-containing protein n=1 Tax=Prorocentrum cordatum TaxID=2364126 RepID=A0ABN9VLD3_9DINO|nr:unnamed protein product [Polarella glacialis]